MKFRSGDFGLLQYNPEKPDSDGGWWVPTFDPKHPNEKTYEYMAPDGKLYYSKNRWKRNQDKRKQVAGKDNRLLLLFHKCYRKVRNDKIHKAEFQVRVQPTERPRFRSLTQEQSHCWVWTRMTINNTPLKERTVAELRETPYGRRKLTRRQIDATEIHKIANKEKRDLMWEAQFEEPRKILDEPPKLPSTRKLRLRNNQPVFGPGSLSNVPFNSENARRWIFANWPSTRGRFMEQMEISSKFRIYMHPACHEYCVNPDHMMTKKPRYPDGYARRTQQPRSTTKARTRKAKGQ